MSIFDGRISPNMTAHININGTVVRTDAALHTACRVGYHHPNGENFAVCFFFLEKLAKRHFSFLGLTVVWAEPPSTLSLYSHSKCPAEAIRSMHGLSLPLPILHHPIIGYTTTMFNLKGPLNDPPPHPTEKPNACIPGCRRSAFLWLIFDGVSITRKILMQKRFRVQHSESSRLQLSQEMTIVRNQNPCGLLSIQMRILGLKELTSLLAQCVNYLLFGCTHL